MTLDEAHPQDDSVRQIRLELLCEMCELNIRCSVPCAVWRQCFDNGGQIKISMAQALFAHGH